MGRTVTDNCDTLPDSPQNIFCHLEDANQTQLKVQGSVDLPWGLQAAVTFQNLPGIYRSASYVATNAEVARSLGRNLSSCPTPVGGTCSATVTIANIFDPFTD